MQVVWCFCGSLNQFSDYAKYVSLANHMINNNHWWYPSADSINSNYIFNPGTVLYAFIGLKLFGGIKGIVFMNILMSYLYLHIVFVIASKLTKSRSIGYISIIIMCLFPSFISTALIVNSDLPFSVLAYAAFSITLSENRHRSIAAGFLLALSNFFRPLAIFFLVSAVSILFSQRSKLREYIKLLSVFAVTVVAIGIIGLLSSGYFIFQSSTFGYNLIMSTYEKTDGGHTSEVFHEGNLGFIEDIDNKTYKERDKIWMQRSIEWIFKNPVKYIKLLPKRVLLLFYTDSYFLYPYSKSNEVSSVGTIKKLIGLRFSELNFVDIITVIQNTLYYICIAASIFGTGLYVKERRWDALIPLAIILFCGTGITIIVSTIVRYHYSFLPIFYIFASITVMYFITKLKERKVAGNHI